MILAPWLGRINQRIEEECIIHLCNSGDFFLPINHGDSYEN